MAQKELALQGIGQPTPSRVEAALNGGSITVTTSGSTTGTGPAATTTTVQLPGVLSLRAGGMGWGKIAHTLGFKLGPVISQLNRTMLATRASGGSEHRTSTAAASGAEEHEGEQRDQHGQHPAPSGHALGQGIVSASGATLSAGATLATTGHSPHDSGEASGGMAPAAGTGIVTAMGSSAQSGASHAEHGGGKH